MSVDYDLVVIGTNAHAYELVKLAAQAEARVAWICDRDISNPHLNMLEIVNVLQELQTRLNQKSQSERYQLFAQEISPMISKFHHNEILEIAQTNEIDVILGKYKFSGRFQNKSHNSHILEVSETDTTETSRQLAKRSLSSRIYAIADELPTSLPKIFGLSEHDYLTANQLLHLEDLPNSIAVLGDDADACVIAQMLNFLGVQTLLITHQPHILPNVDVAIARTFQAQLETEGIKIYTHTQVTAVSQIEHNRSQIWIENTTIECDRLLIPIAPSNFYFPRDRHIYECRSHTDVRAIMRQNLQTNFWSSPSPSKTPTVTYIPTTPPIAQVDPCVAANDRPVYVLESVDEQMGLCKIICDRDGQILRASMIGEQAKFVIEAIAIAIQSKIKVQHLDILPDLQMSQQWKSLHNSDRKRIKLKDWFTFRRDWNF